MTMCRVPFLILCFLCLDFVAGLQPPMHKRDQIKSVPAWWSEMVFRGTVPT